MILKLGSKTGHDLVNPLSAPVRQVLLGTLTGCHTIVEAEHSGSVKHEHAAAMATAAGLW